MISKSDLMASDFANHELLPAKLKESLSSSSKVFRKEEKPHFERSENLSIAEAAKWIPEFFEFDFPTN